MGLEQLEFSILYFFQELHTPLLDKIVPALTFLGNGGWFFILLGIAFLCFRKTRKTGVIVLISLAVGFLIGNLALKNLVMRDRPYWIDASVPLLIANPTDFSFPSGHTLAAFEAATGVFLENKRWGIPMLLFAALIGLSRLYLFVHFPSDVLSGMALGIFIAWYVKRTIEKYQNHVILKGQIKKKAE
ncbi:MAG: phosphatase PAP2 family protein [Clostridium sp.]